MRTTFRVGLALVTVIVAVFVAGYTVSASLSPSFVNSGSTRYAMTSRGPSDTTTTTSTTFVNIAGMSNSIVIPSGKHADLIITFSGMVNTCDAMYVRATIDGAAAVPEYTQFQ